MPDPTPNTGILDTVLKKAYKHHILLIVNLGFAYLYANQLGNLLKTLNETTPTLQVIGIILYAAFFITAEYLISKQLTYDTTIRKLVEQEKNKQQ